MDNRQDIARKLKRKHEGTTALDQIEDCLEKETPFHFKFKTAGAKRRHSILNLRLPNPHTLVNVSVPFPDCLDSNRN
jgi:hypothetical protein